MKLMNAAAHPKPHPWPTPLSDLHELIRRRAEEIYFRNARVPGRDKENWAQAEREIAQELAGLSSTEDASAPPAEHPAEHPPEHPSHRPAVVVTVHGVKYVGEYDPATSEDYHAGEFAKGKPVPVRFDGDRMFVKRPNGKELETRIVDSVVVDKVVENSH
jgi:Protein of unknown function (DUF2934)